MIILQKPPLDNSRPQRSSNKCSGVKLLDCDATQRSPEGVRQMESPGPSPSPSPSPLSMSMQNLFTDDQYRRVSTASSTADGSGGYCLPDFDQSAAGNQQVESTMTNDAPDDSGGKLQRSVLVKTSHRKYNMSFRLFLTFPVYQNYITPPPPTALIMVYKW